MRLPFNPEPLLTLLISKESAENLAGDLEERFQRICRQKRRFSAVMWFWWAFAISLPPIIIQDISIRRSVNHIIRERVEASTIVLDGSLIAAFFLSWTALEFELRKTSTSHSNTPNVLGSIAELQKGARLTPNQAVELTAYWSLRNELVHRIPNKTPLLTREMIASLHRLIEHLRR